MKLYVEEDYDSYFPKITNVYIQKWANMPSKDIVEIWLKYYKMTPEKYIAVEFLGIVGDP